MKTLKHFVKQVLVEATRVPLDIKVPVELQKIADIFEASSFQLFLVGGAVRDSLMGKQPKDWDIATNAEPDQVIAMMRQHREYKLLEVGKSFGVVVIVTPEGMEVEVATFRKDIGVGRRPDAVAFTSLDQDVLRRDLTINALAWSFQTHEVLDFVGGIEDIKNNVVRTVGNPVDRFNEDRLRVLRAFRFAARLGASLDPATANAIKQNNSLRGVSPERIREEFLAGVRSAKSVVSFLRMLFHFDMFDQIFPNLQVTSFVETRNVPFLLASLLQENAPEKLATQLNSLKYSAIEVAQITFLVFFVSMPDNTSIVRLKKMYANSHLNDETLLAFLQKTDTFSYELAKKFLKFQLTVSPVELMAQGLTGKALGIEISRQEQEKWDQMRHI